MPLLLSHKSTHLFVTTCPQQVLELDPGNAIAQKSVQRLTPIVEERREKLKEEMMGEQQLAVLGAVNQHRGSQLLLHDG